MRRPIGRYYPSHSQICYQVPDAVVPGPYREISTSVGRQLRQNFELGLVASDADKPIRERQYGQALQRRYVMSVPDMA
eukprot:3941528-Rhodomonas_salina.2